MPFVLRSPAFAEGDSIPTQFTCDGENRSPALHWSGEPAGTQSFALIVHDPDGTKGDFTHWVLFNLPPSTHDLAEGGTPGVSGSNEFGNAGYGGPCPPPGHGPHRYLFTIYALDVRELDLGAAATRADVEAQTRGRRLGEATLMGRYERRAG